MLEFYFKSPKRLERLRCGPLAEHIADLAAKLHRRGFTRATGQRILSLTGRLNGFAAGAGVEEAAGIDDALAERFINEELRAEGTFREAGSQLRHPRYHRPELVATRPNQVWSWDITKLKGPIKWTYYHLYVMLDLFSRYVVGWLLAMNESASLAARLVSETCAKQNVREGDLTIHADRGTAMTSKTLAEKLIDLGVKKTHSRPRVSNDNPFSEAQFRTLKYWPGFPGRFDSPQHAREVGRAFFPWYNHEHHHSALSYLTPATVHHGQADEVLAERHRVRMAAYLERPDRFVNGPPKLEKLPEAVWINPPEKTTPQIAPGSTQRREDDPEVVPVLTTHAPVTRPGALVMPQGCGMETQ